MWSVSRYTRTTPASNLQLQPPSTQPPPLPNHRHRRPPSLSIVTRLPTPLSIEPAAVEAANTIDPAIEPAIVDQARHLSRNRGWGGGAVRSRPFHHVLQHNVHSVGDYGGRDAIDGCKMGFGRSGVKVWQGTIRGQRGMVGAVTSGHSIERGDERWGRH